MSIVEIYFGEIEVISQFALGETWSEWGPSRKITLDDVHAFANLTDNHQWIHEDVERSEKESPYESVIAHGLFLVTLIPSLLPYEGFRIIGNRVRIIRAIDALRLPSPVFPGDTIHARTRRIIASHAKSGKGTILKRDVEVWKHDGEKPAVTCSLSLQYF